MRNLYHIIGILLTGIIFYSCHNEPPLIEFINPQDSSEYFADTIVMFEILVIDNDGLITELSYSIDAGIDIFKISPDDQPLDLVNIILPVELVQADIGNHVFTVYAKDDSGESRIKSITYSVKDYRDKYTGEWAFYSVQYEWNIEQDFYKYDTIFYDGYITSGSGNKELVVKYAISDSLVLQMEEDGDISGIMDFDMTKSNIVLFEQDTLSLFLYTGGQGTGISLELEGERH